VALQAPTYSEEYTDGAHEVIRRHLAPRLLSLPDADVKGLASVFKPIHGNRMAKASIETALLDAELRARGVSLAQYLGAVRGVIECGVSVGISNSIAHLLSEVQEHVEQGYRRVKLKIAPGWDVEPVRAVRRAFGDELALQVDANTAYTPDDIPYLRELDEYRLATIEQPFSPDHLIAHAELAHQMETPVSLDESITSVEAARDAIRLGACSIINIKPGRVGGYRKAKEIHDLCADLGVPVWCGGMLETGIGRAGNIALAALPNFTLPGDISASARYYQEDLTPAFRLESGRLRVPTGPGLGVIPLPEVLKRRTRSVDLIERQ
jgi:O-succinylbenzoate synthase